MNLGRIKGDALLTTCWFDSTEKVNVSLGGFSISDEMCVNYVHYFPRINLEVCKSSVSWQALRNYFKFVNEYYLRATIVAEQIFKNDFESLSGGINSRRVHLMACRIIITPSSGLD